MSRRGKAAAQARLRARVDPALGVLEYAMKRKDKDLRGALQAAKAKSSNSLGVHCGYFLQRPFRF